VSGVAPTYWAMVLRRCATIAHRNVARQPQLLNEFRTAQLAFQRLPPELVFSGGLW